MSGTRYRAFVCPHCGGVQGDFMRMEEIDDAVTMSIGAERHLGVHVFGIPKIDEPAAPVQPSFERESMSVEQVARIISGLDSMDC
ncbi:hypothetical protein [Bifidobacterium sp. SO1]|uniref:hypothetical protein n=1 Tax=Bifidobacterium sp. SO1 TaxID=2809029 RepID=UPI001BDCDADB|nr:hypothetical protein [Bifidobacterium sp. SO1]MBT1162228.1 hypothetical protein [Bifidobacterium sp. SO1]